MPYSNITFNISTDLAYIAGDIVQLSANTATGAYQNIAGSNSNTGFFLYGFDAGNFAAIQPGWYVVQNPSWIVNSIDTINKTVTINGGVFISGASYSFSESIASNYIIGTVVSYNKNTGVLVITPSTSVGSGTFTNWTINLSGAAGTSGTTGTAGTAGDGSSAGTSGNHGSSGDAASSGTVGTAGTSGDSGTHGTSGFSASSGQSNLSTTSGTSGTAGTNGTVGLYGSSGTSASSGSSGSSGTAASSGTNGTSGNPGASAVSGVNGGTGPTGATGPAGPAGPTGSIAPNTLNYGDAVAFNSATVGNNWFYTGNLQTNANNQGLRTASNGTFISTGPNWVSSGGVGSTAFFSTSTQMAKTNISPFSKSALEIIEDTDIITFNFEVDGQDEQTHIGFIAEDTREELATSTHDRQNLVSTLGVVLKALQELDQKLKTLEGNT